jgi:uncharacterized UBP type Zn finger protein
MLSKHDVPRLNTLRLFAAVQPLLNLSQTCYLSAVLQSLLHNPIIKQYYLSSGHDRRYCSYQRSRASSQNSITRSAHSCSSVETSKWSAEESGPGGLRHVSLADFGLSLGGCMNCELDSVFAKVGRLLRFIR